MSKLPHSSHPATGFPSTTATAHAIERLNLYGYRPEPGEPDPRPFPDDAELEAMTTGIFRALADPLADTALETDTQDLLWSLTDVFHRKADRVQRQLDDNEDRQRKSQAEQDGSEIRSVELERLIEQGISLLERRAAYEHVRDHAALAFEDHTGSVWRPRSGSMVNHKHLTAAVIDSREHIAAKRRAETEVLLPAGPKIVFSGGPNCNDHKLIWDVLDKVHTKHPDMVLLHGGTTTGAERIASCWAAARKVPEIAYKPDWNREGKAAPFKRNDRMLDAMPIGAIVFKGSGITDNLADKARAMRIPVQDCRGSR